MKKLIIFLLLACSCAFAQYPTTANLWVDTTGGTCTRQTTPGAWIDAQGCSSMQAAWNAAQAGDTVIIKNGTYGNQSITSGSKASAVSFYAETPSTCYNQDAHSIALSGQCTGTVLLGAGTATGTNNNTSLTTAVDHIHIYGVVANGSGESRGTLQTGCPVSSFPGCTDIIINGFAGKYYFGQGMNFNSNAASGVTITSSEFGNFNGCTGVTNSTCSSPTDGSNAQQEDIFRWWGYTFGPSNNELSKSWLHDVTTTAGGTCGTCGSSGPHVDILQAFWIGNGVATNNVLDGNIFSGAGGDNNIQYAGAPGTWNGLTMQNNYFGTPACCNFLALNGDACSGTLRIRNNTFAPGGNGLANTSNCSGTWDTSGNIFVNSVASAYSNGNSQTGGSNVFPSSGGTTFGTNAKRCTPTWLNGVPSASNGYDTRLSSSDTCAKDYDASASVAPTDAFGTPRPQGVRADAGAFELQTGGTPTADVTPGSLTFSSQNVGTTSAPQTITLTNNGTAGLGITSITISGTNAGDFAQTNNCPVGAALGIGASCTIQVTTTPTATGSRSASVNINDALGTQSVTLTATGVAPIASLSTSNVTFLSQNLNTTSAAQNITLTNTGTGALSITSIAVGGANSTSFFQSNNCPIGGVLGIGSFCTVQATFTPLQLGVLNATITFTDGASDSPQVVTMSGTGVQETTASGVRNNAGFSGSGGIK